MNRQQFSEFVKNPDLTSIQSLKMLEELVKRYPYCQTGQLLFTYNLFRENDLQYHVQLKKAAAYSGDRKKLKEMLSPSRPDKSIENRSDTDNPVNVPLRDPQLTEVIMPANTASEPEQHMLPEQEPAVSIDKVEIQVKMPDEISPASISYPSQNQLSREDLLEIIRKRLSEIESGTKPSGEKSGPVIPKNKLIEKFILEEPRISSPKATFFNPSDSALRSNVDEEEIISETLARLYANQGNIQKAIHIYKKLSLLNQEKSRYFAAQIENLKS